MDIFTVFDVLFVVCGGYFIFSAIRMKTKGVIDTNIVAQRADVAKIRDKEGAIKYLFPRMIIMGIIIMAGGIGELMIVLLSLPAYLDGIFSFVLMISLLYYILVVRTVRSDYIR